MTTRSPAEQTLPRWCRAVAFACLALASGGAGAAADGARPEPAAALRVQYAARHDALRDSAFGRPLLLDSRESQSELRGDVYARLEYPFATLVAALRDAAPWCEILSLHLNVKGCRAAAGDSASSVTAYVGRKHDEAVSAVHRLDFLHRIDAERPDYAKIVLNAKSGPFGTRDYRIAVEATPVEGGATFVHLSYSYEYGPLAALAMRTYLRTVGAGKVGFTVTGRRPDGRPVLVGDVRGALERNTMRYFLALEAFLGSSGAPPAEQLERRLHDWFAATERYPAQLHEVTLDQYLAMKRQDALRPRGDP